jgi:tRNA1(Val) A37 N6-methylase TrmN6
VLKSSAQSFFKKSINTDSFDYVVINPPFFKKGSGLKNKNKQDQWARHEDKLTLSVWTRGVKKILRTGGELYCVFPTERLAELLTELSKCNVEAKEIWWLKQDKRKRRFFLRAIKGARPGIVVHFDFSLKA